MFSLKHCEKMSIHRTWSATALSCVDMPTIHPAEDGTWFGRDPGTSASFKQNLKQLTALTLDWPGGHVGNYAGYTYWGQFIAHDIVQRPGLVEARTALLDLEGLYGRPSWEQERWWDPSAPMSDVHPGDNHKGASG